MKLGFLLAVVLFIFTSSQVFCAGLVDVEQGIVKVIDKQNSQREALKQVIVKMTGDRSSLSNAGIVKALRSADDYILSYEYSIQDDQPIYKAIFDKNKIERLIRQQKLPLWGAQRPDAIIWLAYATDSNIKVVAEGENTEVSHSILTSAEGRGIPVLLPLMDLDDTISLSETDVWAQFLPVLENASRRYNSDYMLTARIIDVDALKAQQDVETESNTSQYIEVHKLSGIRAFDRDAITLDIALNNQQLLHEERVEKTTLGTFDVLSIPEKATLAIEWYIQGNGEVFSGREFANTSEQLIASFIDIFADLLGKRYAILPNQAATVEPMIIVSNIQSLHDMHSIANYLGELTVVDSARLVSVNGNIATFDLSLLGSLDDLYNTLALAKRLTEVENNAQTALTEETPKLHFFWQG